MAPVLRDTVSRPRHAHDRRHRDGFSAISAWSIITVVGMTPAVLAWAWLSTQPHFARLSDGVVARTTLVACVYAFACLAACAVATFTTSAFDVSWFASPRGKAFTSVAVGCQLVAQAYIVADQTFAAVFLLASVVWLCLAGLVAARQHTGTAQAD